MLVLRVAYQKIKIAFLCNFYDHEMGYISNFLPAELAKLNHEITIIVPVDCLTDFEKKLDRNLKYVKDKNKKVIYLAENFKIMGLKTFKTPIGIGLKNLKEILKAENFNVVQSFVVTPGFINYQIFRYKKINNYAICLQDHTSKSVFKPSKRGWLYLKMFKHFVSKFFNKNTEIVFSPSPDIKEIVTKEYGIQANLISFEPLGVNTEWFHNISEEEKANYRKLVEIYGITSTNKVVLYTGRLSSKKGAEFIADAIGILHKEDSNIVGLFIGEGSEDERNRILTNQGCIILPKQKAENLNKFYWASDIAVWAREGSTSILDSMACGTPTIVRSGLTELERRPFEELVFEEENLESLVDVIRFSFSNPELTSLGEMSSKLITENYSWKKIAKKRSETYQEICFGK